MKKNGNRFTPFLLSIFIVLADQTTKQWIIRNVEIGTVKYSFFNDFLWICHVRNTGVAFSVGDGLSSSLRFVLFVIMPLLVMAGIGYMIAGKKSPFSHSQRIFAAGILGGGLGTLIDRIFRFELGVVDFISVKFYGIFGMDRWPTFNVSDSCVVIFVILFALSVLFSKDDDGSVQS